MRTLRVDLSECATTPRVSAELPPDARSPVALGEHVLVVAPQAPTQEAEVVAVDGPQVTLTVIGRTAAAADHDERAGTWRFRRALTTRELASVKERIVAEGATAGVRALWTVLLLDSDGISFDDAMAANADLDREAYAIPAGQARLLLGWLTTYPLDPDVDGQLVRSPRWAEQVQELWAMAGPASFDDRPGDHAAYPDEPAPGGRDDGRGTSENRSR